MKTKKLFAVLLALLMLTSCCGLFAFAGDPGVIWTYDEATKTVTFSGTGPMPDSCDWKACEIKAVVINDGVTSISVEAFAGKTDLESVQIPGSVKTIGACAFTECNALKNLVIPNGVESIEDRAFEGCPSITTLTIPGSVKTIGLAAFAVNEKLQTLTLEEGVEEIGVVAFGACSRLTTVTLPKSLREIGDTAFMDCPRLETVNYAGSEEDWNKIILGDNVFANTNSETEEFVPYTPNFVYNYGAVKPQKVCKYCGGTHKGFLGFFVGLFHSILALFGLHK